MLPMLVDFSLAAAVGWTVAHGYRLALIVGLAAAANYLMRRLVPPAITRAVLR